MFRITKTNEASSKSGKCYIDRVEKSRDGVVVIFRKSLRRDAPSYRMFITREMAELIGETAYQPDRIA
jgi:hypothetical protein